LLLASLALTGAALLFASLSMSEALDRFVRRGVDDRLDAQIALLLRSVRADGSIDHQLLQEIGPFTRHDRGWNWRMDAPGDTVTSGDIMPLHEPRRRFRRHDRWAHPDESELHSDETARFYLRTLRKQARRGTVTITAGAPRDVAQRMRREAMSPLLLSLGLLGGLLAVTILLQLHYGLRPLGQLKVALGDVRAGRRERVPDDQPHELRDVVAELNHVLDENAASLARARAHVANLAHSLKTPLATLSLKLEGRADAREQELSVLVAQIDRAIRHHLGRARAASPGSPGQLQVDLEVAVAELVSALGQIHAERGIAVHTELEAGMTVKCDPQDLDEMLGNLLDNAWKWARSRVEICAARVGSDVSVQIDDDGPGLSDQAAAQVLVPGHRLDEREGGHGFGLPIARELAELHGGTLALGRSPLGGLRVSLSLPT
jgi:signal transduction histidine kinase